MNLKASSKRTDVTRDAANGDGKSAKHKILPSILGLVSSANILVVKYK